MCGAGILSSLACCVSSSACSLCCASCPSCRNSTASRIGYGLLLIGATVISLICMSPLLKEQLAKIGPICEHVTNIQCVGFVGYFAVYRIMFAMTIFFVLMAAFMIGVKSSQDKRSGIQNGFWAIKILVATGFAVAAFFIPQGSFEKAWMYFGLAGGMVFIVLQLVYLIDFAYTWNESWVTRMEDQGRTWFWLLLGATLTLFLFCVIGIVLMFIFYGGSGCGLHKFFIILNLLLCLFVSGASVLPPVQEANPSSGLLQGAVVSAYVMFLTWGAMTSSTSDQCNPSIKDILTNNVGATDDVNNEGSTKIDLTNILNIGLWVLIVMYSSVRTAGKLGENADEHGGGFLRMEEGPAGVSEDGDGPTGQVVHDDEQEAVAYNYTYFHLVLAAASLYIMMCLTNWLNPSGNLAEFGRSDAAMWVKISSSWVCIAMYAWTLAAPIVLSGRDFSH